MFIAPPHLLLDEMYAPVHTRAVTLPAGVAVRLSFFRKTSYLYTF